MNFNPTVEVFDRLLEIALLIQENLGDDFEGTGLNAARAHLLWELRRQGPSTQRVLAHALDVSPANITGLVDGLESHGYVRRARHPEDRRATVVSLTEHGADTTEAMARDRQNMAAELVVDLDAHELEAFGRTLDKVVGRLHHLVERDRSQPPAGG